MAVLGWPRGCARSWAPTASTGLWWAPLAALGDVVAKTVTGWVAFKDRDPPAWWSERHNRPARLLLALWAVGVPCSLGWRTRLGRWITWGWMAVLLGVGALRVQLDVRSNPPA